jgi:hypothetical protein
MEAAADVGGQVEFNYGSEGGAPEVPPKGGLNPGSWTRWVDYAADGSVAG